MNVRLAAVLGGMAGVASALMAQQAAAPGVPAGQWAVTRPARVEGYTDTPLLPAEGGVQWHVHDPGRPLPNGVRAGAKFSEMAGAPSDAVVLFDGKNLDAWVNERGGAAVGAIADGAFTVDRANGRMRTKAEFGDFQLHLEFATPREVNPREVGQGRGNNGVNIYGLYEIQILDSFENVTYADGQAGAIYGQRPPRVNASRGPGEWQTYDVVWEGPRWDAAGALTRKAAITLLHNGVLVHNRQELLGHTPYRAMPSYEGAAKGKEKGFIELYYHNNAVMFRNIWVRGV
jgi:hypothetical protein